jgi:hypothetical protein
VCRSQIPVFTSVFVNIIVVAREMSSPPIRGLLIDLSGTLHIGSTAVPGAVEALQRLRASGMPFRFCSNTSKESTSSLCQKLRRIGFDIPEEVERKEVWTSLGAVRQLLQDRGLKRFVEFSLSPPDCVPHLMFSAAPGRTSFYRTLQRKSAFRNGAIQPRTKATTVLSSACLRRTSAMMFSPRPSGFSNERGRTPARNDPR